MAFPDNEDLPFIQTAHSGFIIHEFLNKRKKEKYGASNLIESKSFCSDFASSDFYDNSTPAGLKFAFALLTYFF